MGTPNTKAAELLATLREAPRLQVETHRRLEKALQSGLIGD
jgi:hypothetical protein